MALVPTKNPPALIGYYLGVGSLIPVLGFVFSLPALICGVIGVAKSNADPAVGGKGHAITAITLGLLGPLAWVALFTLLF